MGSTPVLPLSDTHKHTNSHHTQAVRRTREAHPTVTIVAGNVVTGEMVEELILSGADVVKVIYFFCFVRVGVHVVG